VPTESSRALPRGPHRLSRDEVEGSQRARLLEAMADAVADKGYARTSVADVLARAGVSRATFYAQFSDKEDCFLAAFDASVEQLASVLRRELERASLDDQLAPIDRLDRVLGIYLELLRGAPSLARTFLIEVYAAGPQAIERRRAALEGFVDIVAETHRGEQGLLGTEPRQRFAAEALVGAVSSMVTNLVGVGDDEGLAELHPRLMQLARTLAR
jgi:AcrR family transcriptional regulator